MNSTTSDEAELDGVVVAAPTPRDPTDKRAETPSHSSLYLPDSPLVVIEPSGSWVPLRLTDLWNYRELLYFLVWRDVKVRYKQTILGAAWALLQPLLTMLIFTLFFGKLAGIQSDGIPYPIFAYAALLPWTFFSNAISNSGNSLVGSTNLITKIYFPRMLIPMAAVGAGLVDFAVAFILLAVLMAYYGVKVTLSLSMLPVVIVLTTLLAVGVGMLLSALNLRYRDVRFVLPFLVQLWMFSSPVIYPLSMVPKKWQWLYALNPMTGIIEGFRSALFGRDYNWLALALSASITLALLVYSAYAFRRMEKTFADLV